MVCFLSPGSFWGLCECGTANRFIFVIYTENCPVSNLSRIIEKLMCQISQCSWGKPWNPSVLLGKGLGPDKSVHLSSAGQSHKVMLSALQCLPQPPWQRVEPLALHRNLFLWVLRILGWSPKFRELFPHTDSKPVFGPWQASFCWTESQLYAFRDSPDD